VKTLSLTSIDEQIHGRRKFAVKIEIDPGASGVSVPSQIGNVPVVVEDYKQRKPMRLCHGDDTYDILPGGVTLNGGTSGSSYFLDYDDDGSVEQLHLTAGHLFGDNCSNQEGSTVDQNSNSWGTVEIHDKSNDTALCAPTDFSAEVKEEIQEENGTTEIVGYVTKNGLGDLSSQESTVYKTGVKTRTRNGKVEDLDVYGTSPDCADYDGEGVGLSIDTYPGDSGGPIYDKGSYGASLIGITSAGFYKSDYKATCVPDEFVLTRTEAPTAYHIQDVHGGSFTSPNL